MISLLRRGRREASPRQVAKINWTADEFSFVDKDGETVKGSGIHRSIRTESSSTRFLGTNTLITSARGCARAVSLVWSTAIVRFKALTLLRVSGSVSWPTQRIPSTGMRSR